MSVVKLTGFVRAEFVKEYEDDSSLWIEEDKDDLHTLAVEIIVTLPEKTVTITESALYDVLIDSISEDCIDHIKQKLGF